MAGLEEFVRLAIRVVTEGELLALRNRFHMSRTTMAGLMGVSPESLKNWESGKQGMKTTTAVRIARWWIDATDQERAFLERGGDVDKLLPLTAYISSLGISQQTVMGWCRARDIDHEDLGVLGTFIYRHELDGVGLGRQ